MRGRTLHYLTAAGALAALGAVVLIPLRPGPRPGARPPEIKRVWMEDPAGPDWAAREGRALRDELAAEARRWKGMLIGPGEPADPDDWARRRMVAAAIQRHEPDPPERAGAWDNLREVYDDPDVEITGWHGSVREAEATVDGGILATVGLAPLIHCPNGGGVPWVTGGQVEVYHYDPGADLLEYLGEVQRPGEPGDEPTFYIRD